MKHSELFPVPREWIGDVDRALAESVQQWADKEVISKRISLKGNYDALIGPALRSLFLDVGLQHAVWPEEHGGSGQNSPEAAMTLTLAAEQAGRADAGMGFVLGVSQTLAVAVALQNDELTASAAPLFCDEQRLTLGSLVLPIYSTAETAGEPQWEGRRLQARATRRGSEWVLNGAKMRPLSSGANAGLFGVLAYVDDGQENPGLFLVPATTAGIHREEPFLKTGLEASRNAAITFSGVRIPEGHLVLRGVESTRGVLAWLHLLSSATCVGALLATFEIITDWGENRVIKGRGQVFKENPLTASLMADLAGRIHRARLLVFDLAHLISQPEVYGPAGGDTVYITALHVSQHVLDSSVTALDQTMELMGSAGYAREWFLERYWRDVKTIQAHLGAELLSRMEMARHYFDCAKL